MHQIIYVIFVACFSLTVSAWDIAVAVGDEINFLNSSGHVMAQISEEMKHMRALAYNPELQHIYFSDIEQSQFSVLKLTIPEPISDISNRQVVVKPLVTKQASKVQGVAFDHVTHVLYWTTGNGSSIKWLKISENDHEPQPGSILLEFHEEVPIGIAVDTCRRYLYWTNCNLVRPSIERSLLDGSDREVVINTNLFQPHGITIDQNRQRIYWVDTEGFDFRLESAGLNGEDRKLIIQSTHQEPFALAISGNNLFWTDWTNDAVWQVPLDRTQDKVIEPVKVRDFISKTPAGIVSSSQQIVDHSQCKPVTDMSQMQNDGPIYVSTNTNSLAIQAPEKISHAELSAYCLNHGIEKNSTTTKECYCLPGYSGEHCETYVCHNYCVHGSCSVDSSGNSKCDCEHGWTGDRCGMDTCDNYCLNNGHCYKLLTDPLSTPRCKCAPDYEGDRCEQPVGGNIQEFCDRYCKYFAVNSETVVLQTSQFCRCQNSGEELSNVSIAVAHVIDGSGSCMWRDLNDSIRTILMLICIVLVVVIIVLVKQIYHLRKRPRIKKRIIVNKSTPLTSRPQPDQCEITIENCCNMNICETPCFEPEFRTPLRSNGKKEEKKNLLTGIELPPDDLY